MGKSSRGKQRRTKSTVATGLFSRSRRREIFARVKRGIVGIAYGHPHASHITGPTSLPVSQLVTLRGTGFLVDSTGIVITAGHVVDGWIQAQQRRAITSSFLTPDLLAVVSLGTATSPSETVHRFSTVYVRKTIRAPNADVAVLYLGDVPPEASEVITPLELSDEPCQEGDRVATCGYPFGLELHGDTMINASFAEGIVSAILPHAHAQPSFRQAIQLDAFLNPGNSGGPVFDVETGDVVGIAVSVMQRTFMPPPGQGSRLDIPTGLASAEDIYLARFYVEQLRSQL